MASLVVLLLLAPPALAQSTPDAQTALVRDLLAEDVSIRSQAAHAACAIAPAARSDELRLALIEALARETARHRAHALHVRSGGFDSLEEPELVTPLIKAVAESADPRSIPALAGALGTGIVATRALAAFADQAVPDVVAVGARSDAEVGARAASLVSLRFMVERRDIRPLSAASLARINQLAAETMATSGRADLPVLWAAIDLAVALNTFDLRVQVERFTDWNRVAALIVDDDSLVEQTRKKAADRLAGRPALPIQ